MTPRADLEQLVKDFPDSRLYRARLWALNEAQTDRSFWRWVIACWPRRLA